MNAQEYTLPREVRTICPARINLRFNNIREYRGLLALGSL